MLVSREDSLAGLSRDRLLIGGSGVRKITKGLVTGWRTRSAERSSEDGRARGGSVGEPVRVAVAHKATKSGSARRWTLGLSCPAGARPSAGPPRHTAGPGCGAAGAPAGRGCPGGRGWRRSGGRSAAGSCSPVQRVVLQRWNATAPCAQAASVNERLICHGTLPPDGFRSAPRDVVYQDHLRGRGPLTALFAETGLTPIGPSGRAALSSAGDRGYGSGARGRIGRPVGRDGAH